VAKVAPPPPPPAAAVFVADQVAAPAAAGAREASDDEDDLQEAEPAINDPAQPAIQRPVRRSVVRMLGDAHAVRNAFMFIFLAVAHIFLGPHAIDSAHDIHQTTLKQRIATRLSTYSHTKKRKWIDFVTTFHQELPVGVRQDVDLPALKKLVR
jgi:hypothetical protein